MGGNEYPMVDTVEQIDTLPSAPLDEARLAAAHALIEQVVVPAQSPSAVLAVARREGPASIRGFGLARWDPEEVPAGADTVYGLASLTKPFVALAAVQLAERGRLGLDDPVARHVPEFAGGASDVDGHGQAGYGRADGSGGGYDRGAVTVRHLLAHTAGLDWVWEDARWLADPSVTRRWETLARTACAAPLLFAPGAAFRYAGTNYIVLAEVVRRCSGLRIDAYLREHVFAPLGMADTGFFPHDDPALRPRVAQVAIRGWPEDRTARATTNSFFPPEARVPNPGGGLRSSARDLVTFGRMCLRLLRGEQPAGAPLTRAALEAMLQNTTGGLPSYDTRKGPVAPPRGLGWELPGLDPEGRAFWSPSAFGHAGSSGTVLRIDPARDLVVAFLGSRNGGLKSKQRVANAAAGVG